MRLTTPLKTVLAGSAALALLTACGGGSDDSSSSSSPATTSATASSAEQSSAAPDAEAVAFCDDAQSAFTDLESAFTNAGSDLTAIPALLAQASDRLAGIEPPADISTEWTSFTSALGSAADSVQGLDLSTPEGQQQFSAAFGQLQTTAAADQATLQQYLTDTCGIQAGTESAAPTS